MLAFGSNAALDKRGTHCCQRPAQLNATQYAQLAWNNAEADRLLTKGSNNTKQLRHMPRAPCHQASLRYACQRLLRPKLSTNEQACDTHK